MRILRILSILPVYQPFYEVLNSLDVEKLTYQQIIDEFRSKKIFFPSSFCSSMKKLGYEAFDVFFDFFELQKKWCEENNESIDFSDQRWLYKCLETQINLYKPDILYFERSALGIPCQFCEKFKKLPFIRVICGTISWQLTDFSILGPLKYFNVVFGLDQFIVDQLRSLKFNSEILDHSFDYDEEIFESEKKYDLTYVGSSGYGFCDSKGIPDHYHRYHNLIKMIQKTPIKLWCYEKPISKEEKLFYKRAKIGKFLPYFVLKNFLFKNPKMNNYKRYLLELKKKERRIPWHYNKRPLIELFPKRVSSGVFGKEYLNIISQSKISYNSHIDNPYHGGNKRCYEVTAMGSCLLCDREDQIKHLFEPDKEAVYYSTIEDAIDKAKYLINNDKTCQQIAKEGQKRTLKDHTYFNRCKTIIKKIQKFL